MSNSSNVKAIRLQDYDTALFGAGWVSLNPAGLEQACFKIIYINDSNVDVDISYDGVNTHDIVRSGTERILDFQANAGPNGQVALMKKGLIISISSTAGAGVGLISLVGYYQDKN
jgi:hypothetical protein